MKHNVKLKKTRKKKYVGTGGASDDDYNYINSPYDAVLGDKGIFTEVGNVAKEAVKPFTEVGNVAKEALKQFTEVGDVLAKTAANQIDNLIPKNIISDLVGDDYMNKDWNVVAPNLSNNINETAHLIRYAARQPELRKILEDAIFIYGEALSDIFKIGRPVIMDLTDRFWEMVHEIAKKSSAAAVNAMIDGIMSALAEIPGIGGVIDMVVALTKWFNLVTEGLTAPTTVFSGYLTGETFKFGREAWAFHKQHGKQLSQTYNDVSKMLKKAKTIQQSAQKNSYAPNMSGGHGNANLKVMRNIHTSIKRFTKKHPVKARFV